jgi:hypothetical protein
MESNTNNDILACQKCGLSTAKKDANKGASLIDEEEMWYECAFCHYWLCWRDE